MIAGDSSGGLVVYKVRWEIPADNETTDLSHFRVQVGHEAPLVLTNTSQEALIQLPPGSHSFSITAVDRCNHKSPPAICRYDQQEGMC